MSENLSSRSLLTRLFAMFRRWRPIANIGPKSVPDRLASLHHAVIATSFADPADVRRYRACKAAGKTDRECFRVGDNGIGYWGDNTTLPLAMCALPREDWQPLKNRARGARVIVEAGGLSVICKLADTMPSRKNITNGAGIDLNPHACQLLGFRPPVREKVEWWYVDED